MNIVALIPARAGSKRIPGKNTKLLYGKPLIQWTIEATIASGVFDSIVVSTDDTATINWVINHHRVPFIHERDPRHAQDDSPDIWWVRSALTHKGCGTPDAFAILRPTSPFRTADTIRRAFERFSQGGWSSIRAVEPVKQHPGKMWLCRSDYKMVPLIGEYFPAFEGEVPSRWWRVPWHSQPTQSLPKVYVQNASLEMAWTWCVTVLDSISGPNVAPFFTEGYEGFDINTPEDWERAEALAPSLLGRV